MTEKELKAAYRALALRYHPDQHPGDTHAEDMFKQISEAYAVLSDPIRRKQYDRAGFTSLAVGKNPFGSGIEGVKRFFESLFGELKNLTQQPEEGRDLKYTLELSLEEAALGGTRTISFPIQVECGRCQGTGSSQGRAGWRICLACEGEGVLKKQGTSSGKEACGVCQGRGRIILSPCYECEGRGRVTSMQERTLALPGGVSDGELIRFPKQGESGKQGGDAGNLWILIHIKPHPLFRRQESILLCDVPITWTQATLGGRILVPTLDGSQVELSIPKGTDSGTMLRVRGKGFPRKRNSSERGDIHYRLFIETPKDLSAEQSAFTQKINEVIPQSHYPKQNEFLKNSK